MEQQAQELDRTRIEALTDSLSGVANRKSFDDTLNYWLSSERHQQSAFSLILADIDHFKRINDTHGHAAGDLVVTHVGSFLNEHIGEEDFVGRYGGDEFALLIRQESLEDAVANAKTVHREISLQNFNVGIQGERIAVTFSMGLAEFRPDDTVVTIRCGEYADQQRDATSGCH